MVKKLTMILAGLFLSIGMATAQTQISGTVVSEEDGEPIIGASVIVVGATNVGVATDIDGRFTLTLPAGRNMLRVSYVGMATKEVAARNGMVVNLVSDANSLDEIVVVAYGTQKKTSLTGSIQSVKSEQIELRPTSSVASALEGTVTGVQVNSTYGSPGSDPSIRIRGIGTVNGSSSPLYVIDGVPFGGNVSDLNPADIESMSVLKDAASAALYGNRASNGVILITTKKAKQGRLNVSLDIKQGTYSRGIPEYDRLGVKDFMETEWMNMYNTERIATTMGAIDVINNPKSTAKDIADAQARLAGADATAREYAMNSLIGDRLYLNIFNQPSNALFTSDGKMVAGAEILSGYRDDLDWYDQALRKGYRQEYNVTANGANDKADYLFSLGYLDEQGYQYKSSFNRLSARVAANFQPKKWIKMGVNLAATHQNFNQNWGDSDRGFTNVFMYAREIAPIYPVHLHDVNTGAYLLDADGNKQYDGGSYIDENGAVVRTRNQMLDRHVIWENEVGEDKTVRNTINGTAYADIYLPYNFTFTLKGNLNVRHSEENQYNSAVIGDGKGNNGRGKREDYRYKNYTFQQQLTWNNTYGVHSIDALIGHENYYYTYNYLYGYKTNQVFEGKNYLRNFTEITSLYDYNTHYTTESYLARARYHYDDRYNAEVSFRRDGSSRFAKGARWGNFWSVGANWVISNEQFMKKYDWVNYLKLRADYGEVGNDAGAGYFGYMALYSSTQNANKGAYWISQLPNFDLKWETGQSWGIALEGRLWNRLNFTIEYFDKRNKDLLFDVYNPLSAGATSTTAAESVVTRNIGTIANRGWEFAADVDVFKNKDWRINVGANITLLKNKVLKLPEQNKDGIISGTKKIVEGKDRYQYFVWTYEGINTANGYSLYKFNDEDYFFKVDNPNDPDNPFVYGKEAKEDGTANTEITGNNLNGVVVIDGVPYSYLTNYAKKEYHGSALPKAYGSFNFNVTWKGLTLATLFTYQLGGKVIEYNYQALMTPSGSSPKSLHKDILNSWTFANQTDHDAIDRNMLPVITSNALLPTQIAANLNSTSSHWLKSASYLVLKNINLTYQFPKSLVRKIDLEGIALTVACENLFSLTSLKGMNPQQSFDGTQYNYLVTPRVFSVGLNVRF